MSVNPLHPRDELSEAPAIGARPVVPKQENPQTPVGRPAVQKVDEAHAAIEVAHHRLTEGLLSAGAVLECLTRAAAKPGQRPSQLPAPSPLDALDDEDIVGHIENSVAALDDPRSQPAPDYESMLYVRNASDYRYRLVKKPLWGTHAAPHPGAVHMNFTAEGDLAAAIQSVLAAAPQRQILQPLSNDTYRVHLFIPSTTAGRFKPVDFVVDGAVLASPGGRLIGGGEALAPLLIAKAVAKLYNVLNLVGPRDLTWSLVTSMLTGKAAHEHRNVDAATLEQCIAAWQRGAPGVISFCDVLDLAVSTFADGKLEAVLGSLGLRVRAPQQDLDVVLLSQHQYSVIGLDDPHHPTAVLLSNPLGYNPDLQKIGPRGARLPKRDFMLPEEVADLPHAPATFRFPLAWLQRLVRSVGIADT